VRGPKDYLNIFKHGRRDLTRPGQRASEFLEYSGDIGQLSLGNPLPYLLPYLELSYEHNKTSINLGQTLEFLEVFNLKW
jgi:hypothetical protein